MLIFRGKFQLRNEITFNFQQEDLKFSSIWVLHGYENISLHDIDSLILTTFSLYEKSEANKFGFSHNLSCMIS